MAKKTKLVIVESPSKAKTIGKYLGRDYIVKASFGHIRDLPKSKLGVDTENDFTPQYLIPRDKSATVKELKAKVKEAGTIYLATDPDREGEAIAWHLLAATGAMEQGKKVHRIEFHEITKEAILEAVAHPRPLNMQLVNAQQARRILDRLVGYKISPLLWKKVKRGLSAGRVQSVAVKLIVDREHEVEAFQADEYWTIEAELSKTASASKGKTRKTDQFNTTLASIKKKKPVLNNAAEANAVLSALDGADFTVSEVRRKEQRRNPVPPFITSTIQQEAARKLNYTAKRTMIIAQQLYEGIDLGKDGTIGLITYMRTDSTNIASVAQAEARELIAERYGAEYVPAKPPVYSKKSKNAQEAHEAIRPTSVRRDPEQLKPFLSPEQDKLYRLIWQRFLSSQMAPAVFDSTSVDIAAGPPAMPLKDRLYLFRASGSVIKFPGFLAVYQEGLDDGAEDEMSRKALPMLENEEQLALVEITPNQHFTQPPPRFNEATLVKSLEEKPGIGRPSTYAPTLQTIQDRGYITKEAKRFIPTELGSVVNRLLSEFFPGVVDAGFTSHMEEELDEIADGGREWVPVVRDFYTPFAAEVDHATINMEKVEIANQVTDELCDKCGRNMVIKMSKFGKFLACPGFPECRNTKPILDKTGVKCPRCNEGELIGRKGKKTRGRTFYGCSRYPDCDFTIWQRPSTVPCPQCAGVLVAAGQHNVKCIACDYTGPRPEVEETEETLKIPAIAVALASSDVETPAATTRSA